jgi:hypothetical protein
MKTIILTGHLLSLCFVLNFAQTPRQQTPQKVKFLIKAVSGNEDKGKGNGKLVFRAGEKILIKTLLKNDSANPFPLVVTNIYYQYRFQLWKIGEKRVRGVRADKAIVISNGEESRRAGHIMKLDPLPSGKFIELKTFDLGEIYEVLEPGQYKLNVFYRPEGRYGNVKISSNTLILEIVP